MTKTMSEIDKFYFACLRDKTGSNMVFHGKPGRGYVTDLDQARMLTKEQAQRAWEAGRSFDLPVSARHVRAQAKYKVDCQRLPESINSAGVDRWVAYQCRRWDGNDLYWLSDDGATPNFAKAKVFAKPQPRAGIVFIPFEVADKVKRLTFDAHLLNPRKMTQGRGLVTPDHIKKQKRQKLTTKTRLNCDQCGRIYWSYDPYATTCKNFNCEDSK